MELCTLLAMQKMTYDLNSGLSLEADSRLLRAADLSKYLGSRGSPSTPSQSVCSKRLFTPISFSNRFKLFNMKIISTFHPSSSVISSVKCQLGSRDLEHLVVAKINRLDVYSLRPHGLQRECGVNIWGKTCSVKSIRISVGPIHTASMTFEAERETEL